MTHLRIAFRWLTLALFLSGLAGCSGSSDATADPNSPVVKARLDKIEQLKAKAAKGKTGARPTH